MFSGEIHDPDRIYEKRKSANRAVLGGRCFRDVAVLLDAIIEFASRLFPKVMSLAFFCRVQKY